MCLKLGKKCTFQPKKHDQFWSSCQFLPFSLFCLKMAKICCFCLAKSQRSRQKTRPPPYLYMVSLVVILSKWVCDNWVYRFPKQAPWPATLRIIWGYASRYSKFTMLFVKKKLRRSILVGVGSFGKGPLSESLKSAFVWVCANVFEQSTQITSRVPFCLARLCPRNSLRSVYWAKARKNTHQGNKDFLSLPNAPNPWKTTEKRSKKSKEILAGQKKGNPPKKRRRKGRTGSLPFRRKYSSALLEGFILLCACSLHIFSTSNLGYLFRI